MIQGLTAGRSVVPGRLALWGLLGAAALGAAAVGALWILPPISAGEPGLSLPAPYGVHMGMPLDQAVSLLEQQGFLYANLELEETQNLRSGWRNAWTIVVMSAEIEGLLRYAIAAGEGEERITAGALALIRMTGQEPDGSRVDVVLEAGWDGVVSEGPGEGPVYSVKVERIYPEAADWSVLLAAESRLRATAGVEPSCGADVPAYVRAEWIFSAEASDTPRAAEEICSELARVFPWDRWDDLLDAIWKDRAPISPLVDRATLASYETKGQSAFWLDREDLRLEHALLADAVERLRSSKPFTLAR